MSFVNPTPDSELDEETARLRKAGGPRPADAPVTSNQQLSPVERLLAVAKDLCLTVDRNHRAKEQPLKFTVPWRQVVELEQAAVAVEIAIRQCLCAQRDGQIVETHLACPIHGVKVSSSVETNGRASLFDMAHEVIKELHRQDMKGMRAERDGAVLRITPLNEEWPSRPSPEEPSPEPRVGSEVVLNFTSSLVKSRTGWKIDRIDRTEYFFVSDSSGSMLTLLRGQFAVDATPENGTRDV